MNDHETRIEVRYGETGHAGHVNNTSYFLYLEHARKRFFRTVASGGDGTAGMQFILASVKCEFYAQAYAEQTLTIVTKVARIGNKSFDLVQPVVDSRTGKPVAQGFVSVVCFDYDRQTSMPIPPHLRSTLDMHRTGREPE